MKNLKNKLIACTLATVTAFSVSVSFKKFAPVTAYAATAETFLSDVALVYEDSVEDAQEAITGTDWKLFNSFFHCFIPLFPCCCRFFNDSFFFLVF